MTSEFIQSCNYFVNYAYCFLPGDLNPLERFESVAVILRARRGIYLLIYLIVVLNLSCLHCTSKYDN